MSGKTASPPACPLAALLAALLAILLALPATPVDGATLLIDGATVHPITSEPFVGQVLIADGRIRAVGTDLAVPADAEHLEAAGLHLYPGLCDALSQIGLVEIGAVEATDDTREAGTYNPHLRAATALHPASELIPVARAEGITHTLVAPRSPRGGVIPGQASLVHLSGWTVEEMSLDLAYAPALALVIDWPEIETRRFDFTTFTLRTAPYAEAEEQARKARRELTDWLTAARHYAQAMAAGSARVPRDLRLEALAEILSPPAGRGEPVIIQADAKEAIEAAVGFAEEQGLRMILAGGRDAGEVADLLAEKGIPVILGFTLSLPREEDDPYDLPFTNAGRLAASGVRIAFASGAGGGFGPGGPHGSRTLPFEAAVAVAYGLPREEALKALTLYPAQILGVGEHLGAIEPGKIANLILTDGDPLRMTTHIHHVIIAGQEVSTANKHRSLYERYRARE